MIIGAVIYDTLLFLSLSATECVEVIHLREEVKKEKKTTH
jgi:hypothetical protein